MSDQIKWLQFFADGGASGGDGGSSAGADSGVSSADAGQSTGVGTADAGRTLEDLGVPKHLAEKYRERKAKKAAATADRKPAQAQNNTPAQQQDEWELFMSKPEHKQRLESMMSERGKAASEAKRAAEKQAEKYDDMFRLLANHYGIAEKDGGIDKDAVLKAVTDDDLYYEDRALERGETIAQAKEGWKQSRQEELQAKEKRDEALRQHFFGMQKQEPELQKMFPDFNLSRELENPVFFQRSLPESKMSVADVYFSIHHDEIMEQMNKKMEDLAEAISRKTKEDYAKAVRSGSRPKENGSSSMGAVSSVPDKNSMSFKEYTAYILNKFPPNK